MSKNKPYECSCLKKNTEIRKSFITKVKNRFEILLNTSSTKTADSTFAHFETSCKEIAKEIIPLKPKLKKRLPWETLEISNKRTILQETAEKRNSHPTMENIRKFKKVQTNLVLSYDKEQSEYIQSKIDEIQNAVRNQKSAKAWKIVNEVSGRKNSCRSIIKAKNNEERVKLWQKHFQDLLGKPTKINENEEEISQIENSELDIKKGLFTPDEIIIAVRSIQHGKAVGLDEIPAEVWQLDPIKRWNEGCLLPFPKKGNLALINNYRGITLTSISSKIYNLMLLNRIRPKIEDILRKNQNGFRTNRSTTGQILTIRRLIEGVKSKNVPAILLFIDFSKAFDSINRLKLKYILSAYRIPKEKINAIMILYTNTRAMVISPDGDTPFFDITTGVLQGDTLAPYLFIICLDYIMRKSIDNNSQYGLTLTERKSSRYPEFTITDVDYAYDIAITTNNIKKPISY